jgi:acetyl esterase/lipase
MRIDDYPRQEPPSAQGAIHQAECLRRGTGVSGEEIAFGSDPYQRLTIYPAEPANGTVVVFWHGGGWTGGYKEMMAFMAPAFTAAGVTFVSPGYRLAPQHIFPTGLQDCADAVAKVFSEARRFGGDPNNIFLGGHSAGGQYAALLAVTHDWRHHRKLPADVVRGCLPLSGVFLFGQGAGLSMKPRFLGADPANEHAASPLLRIEGPPPPFFISHGENDFPHLMRQAEAMEAALRQAGGVVERFVLPGRDHFTASYAGGEPDGPWVGRAGAWISTHSRKKMK